MNGSNGQERLDVPAYGVMAQLVGVPTPEMPSSLSEFTTLLNLALLAIIAVQIAAAGRSIFVLRRWNRNPSRQPRTVTHKIIRLGDPRTHERAMGLPLRGSFAKRAQYSLYGYAIYGLRAADWRKPWVAGYNLMNEPADESRAVVGPFYERLAAAIRAVDPDHILLFDGNTYSTEFGFFGEPLDNAVYTLHDYVPAGLGRADHYDPEAAEQKFLQRSAYARETGTPIYVGEFAPIYTGDPTTDAVRVQILEDQLERYRRHDAGFATWMYKDLGRQGLTYAKPDSPYGALVADFVAKKTRLGVDQWGSAGREYPEVTQPIQDLVAREAPDYDPYPWGRFDWVRTLVLNITLAQPLTQEYAELFRGLGEPELVSLADSFAFAGCGVRETLRDQLERS